MSAVADASCCVETFNEKAQQQYRNEIKKKEEKKEVERMSLEKKREWRKTIHNNIEFYEHKSRHHPPCVIKYEG